MLWKLIKLLLVLLILAGIGLVVYAYVGPLIFPSDFDAPTQTVTQPIELDVE
ncbi:hypothetical protein [Marivivens aquimaris]|uniref:hypothetical protein n=1 Tax=Marivivens aquimaris TaxID=2774876 RepID=UPI0018824330|nr:hypothetical protein [Marivivens aquimaris]